MELRTAKSPRRDANLKAFRSRTSALGRIALQMVLGGISARAQAVAGLQAKRCGR